MITQKDALLKLIHRKTPQARAGLHCVYNHRVHGGCAVGCLLPSELAVKLTGTASNEFENFPKEIQDLGKTFLQYLQAIHDDDGNWIFSQRASIGPEGLVWNYRGINRINYVIDKYKLDIEPIRHNHFYSPEKPTNETDNRPQHS